MARSKTCIGLALAALSLVSGETPADAAWHEARTTHFIVYADQRPEELRAFAERLERFDQAVRKIRGTADPALTDSNRLTIFVVNSLNAIERLAGDGAAGFYSVRASGSVAFVPQRAGSKSDKWDMDAEAIFFHEYAHHLQLQYVDLALPIWISEGFAEFFAPTKIRDDGSVAIGVMPAYRARLLLDYGELTIEEMLGGGPKLTGMEFLETYGRGWLLTHYLTFNRARRGQIELYVAAIQNGTAPLAAARSAFGNLKQLNRELHQYLRQKMLPQMLLSGAQLSTGAIRIRPLTMGQAAMMPAHLRTRSGVDKASAQKVAMQARRIAGGYPRDAWVQLALAEAEFDVDNYAAAEAATDRARATAPDLYRALISKGRARMELGKSQGGANWNEVRQWFLRANKIDPEAAEPLFLYYKTYLYAGARPTKNAVDGLLYAMAIAPRDHKLRLAGVRQMLFDGRIAEAKKYFAPIGFLPHANKKWREASTKLMASLDSNDREGAIANLYEAEKLVQAD